MMWIEQNQVYVAGSWEDRKVVSELMESLRKNGYVITEDWTDHEDITKAPEYARRDLAGIRACYHFIYVHSLTKSSGKVFELGFATALDKRVILYDLNLTGIREGCVFIRGTMFRSVNKYSDLLAWLKGDY